MPIAKSLQQSIRELEAAMKRLLDAAVIVNGNCWARVGGLSANIEASMNHRSLPEIRSEIMKKVALALLDDKEAALWLERNREMCLNVLAIQKALA